MTIKKDKQVKEEAIYPGYWFSDEYGHEVTVLATVGEFCMVEDDHREEPYVLPLEFISAIKNASDEERSKQVKGEEPEAQPFENFPELAESILHAANHWQTDSTWSRHLELINQVCSKVKPASSVEPEGEQTAEGILENIEAVMTEVGLAYKTEDVCQAMKTYTASQLAQYKDKLIKKLDDQLKEMEKRFFNRDVYRAIHGFIDLIKSELTP